VAPTVSHGFSDQRVSNCAIHVPSERGPFQLRTKGHLTELLQNEQLGCAKTNSRYGEPAEEMGVQQKVRGVALSGLARDRLTAFDLCTYSESLEIPPITRRKCHFIKTIFFV
jgi:hypothetical protein